MITANFLFLNLLSNVIKNKVQLYISHRGPLKNFLFFNHIFLMNQYIILNNVQLPFYYVSTTSRGAHVLLKTHSLFSVWRSRWGAAALVGFSQFCLAGKGSQPEKHDGIK